MSKQLNDFFLSIVDLKKINNVDRKKNLQILEILNHLFLVRETTQMQISKKLNISRPSTVGIMNQLIDKGIVIKKESAKSRGGRKPNLFALHKQFFFVLSIQIVRFNIKLALIDNNHTIIKEEIINSTLSSDSEIGNLLIEHSLKLLNSAKIKMGDLIGIGINVPSLVSAHTIDKFSSYSFQLELKIIKNNFEIKFKKPVYILNDAKSACLAEFRFGLARDKNNVLVISMDWGIGLGIIMGGRMHSGESGFDGEFGHIPMTEDGLLCHCGKRGCLETEASGLALVRKTKEGLKAGQTSILNNLSQKELDKLEPEVIIDAANKGDQFAINVLSEIGIKLGKGIAILIQIFNPELVILEGKIAEAKQFITTPIHQSMNTYCMMQLKERTRIELSELGSNSSLFGGTIAVMDNIFKDQVALVKSYIN